MAASFIRSFQVTNGVIAGEATPVSAEELYTSPDELNALYGCQVTEQDIRAAMALIHGHTNRTSLFPVEYDSGIIEVPYNRQETRLPITPVVQLTELAGRYGMQRRDAQSWNSYGSSIAAYLTIAGTRPQWTPIDISLAEVDQSTGILYLPVSTVFLAPYAFIRAKFIAGYITIPDRVKLAIFELIQQMHARGVSDRVRYSAGRVSRQYAGSSFMSDQARQLLEPFVVHSLY